MKKTLNSQSGFLSGTKLTAATALVATATLLSLACFATTPTNGTLSPSTPEITFTGGPFLVATNADDNATGPVTCDTAHPCEDFGLTIDIPQTYKDTHPSDIVRVVISWDDPTGGQDLDTWLVNNPDNQVYPAHAANGGDNPEVINVPMSAIQAGAHQFFVRVAPFVSTGQAYSGKVSLITQAAASPTPTPPAEATGIRPRYYNYSPGPGLGETAGEPSIGYNLTTHKAMYISGLQTLRVTLPETGACEATWEDVSNIVTKTRSLDPILFTDQRTGRTFVSQLDSVPPPAGPSLVFVGVNSFMAYTDDDGATWTPAQINPPDGSYDHQTVGAGPYPALLPLSNPLNKGDAVYYCSQAGVTAFCSRSDDGGLNFGRSTAIYNAVTDGCGGIHGHVKVAPDGTVYVPNRGCNGVQSLAVSENAGITWQVRPVQGPGFSAGVAPVILDPSVAIASDGTLYFSWIEGTDDGLHAHVAVSHDKGQTWSNNRDIGATQGLHNVVFVEAVAGDPDRAAVGFVGTTEPGNHEADDFKGTWYVFMAHTYDSGNSWMTVNATPGDPVQREAGIWNEGGSSPLRNLLDFNEITMDEKGRVLYGYADGCIDQCVTGAPNSFTAKASIARQSGGKGLLGQFDPQPAEPVLPQTACLSGHRDDLASYLTWRAPDNGGAEISTYRIYRSVPGGNEQLVGHTGGTKTSFNDRTADPTVATYVYRVTALNSVGESQPSNPLPLTVGPRSEPTGACSVPGVQVVVDPAGDENDTLPQHDVTSVSISEPQDLPGKLVFTMKIADLSQALTPAFRWSVRFNIPNFGPPDSTVIGPQEDWFVSMITSDGGTPTFTYGTTGSFTPQGAQVPARFFTTVGNLDPASNYTPDGTITLVLNKSDVQSHAICSGTCGALQPGQAININLGSVRAAPPSVIPGAGGTNETIPDTTGPGIYNLRPANLCLPNTAPLAGLAASTNQGLVPLTVQFNGGSSVDPDSIDHIASYTFNFGEGEDDVAQNTPIISHQFANPGLYDVKLVVTDSRGKMSSNTAHQVILVQQPFGLANVVSHKAHGTTGSFDINLPLTDKAGIECRTPGPNNSYQLIYTFNRDVSVAGTATLAQGSANSPTTALGPQSNQVTVNLSNVSNKQHLVVNLNGVRTAAGEILNGASGRMDLLIGDVNASGHVDAGDIGIVQRQNSKPVIQTNFRSDVNASNHIDAGDIGVVRQQNSTSLP
jgi:PKD domain-containing protein